MKKPHFGWLVGVTIALATVLGHSAFGQDKIFKNSVSISYTNLRFLPYNQYIGAGIEYRFMAKPWVGAQVQISKFPQTQSFENNVSGGPMVQEDASILIGHRWRKVGIYAEGGAGVLRADVFKGISLPQETLFFDVRYYRDIILGGLVDVPVGRRWSLTFNVRDNMTYLGPYTGIGPYGPTQAFVGTVNAPEGRAGVAFHF